MSELSFEDRVLRRAGITGEPGRRAAAMQDAAAAQTSEAITGGSEATDDLSIRILRRANVGGVKPAAPPLPDPALPVADTPPPARAQAIPTAVQQQQRVAPAPAQASRPAASAASAAPAQPQVSRSALPAEPQAGMPDGVSPEFGGTAGTSQDYSVGEFVGDAARVGTGSLVGGTLRAPKGVESGVKGIVRDVATGDIMDKGTPGMRLFNYARMALMDALGIRSIQDQMEDKQQARIAVDRALSGVSVPGTDALANYGDKVQKDILAGMSEEGKRRMAGAEPKGNIFKGEFSWGDDPTVAGYALQAVGVLGSLAPVVATAIVTRNPNAAAAVGGGMAAGEGVNSAKEYIGKLSHQQLLEVSPYYKAMIDRKIPQAEARRIVTDKAGESAAVLQGMVAALGGRVTGKLVTGAYDDLLARVGGRTVAGRVAVGGSASALEEGVQEVGEGVAADIGIRSQIENKEIGEGSAANLVLGAIGGGPVGAVRAAIPTNEQRIADAIDRGVESRSFDDVQTGQQAISALDPNRGTPTAVENLIKPGAIVNDTPGPDARYDRGRVDPSFDPLAAPPAADPFSPQGLVNDIPNPDDRYNRGRVEPSVDLDAFAQGVMAGGERTDPALGDLDQNLPGATADQQLSTAVPGQNSDLNLGQAQPQAQPMSLRSDVSAAGTVDQNDLQQMLDEVDARNQQALGTAVSQQQSQPETLTNALASIGQDLGVNPGEQLNVTEVTSDKRLNTFAKALAQAFGVNVHWVDFGEQGMTVTNEAGETRNLGAFNGYRVGDTILVGANADLMDTTWHELTHVLETRYADVYKALRDAVVKAVDPQMQQRLFDSLNASRMREVGRPMTQQELESELVAYTVGQQATDPQLLNRLFDSFQDKTLAQQFKDILVDILNKLSAALRGPQYIKDRQRVIQAREAIVNAFKEYQKREAAKSSMPPALAAVVARGGVAPVTSAAQPAQPGATGVGTGSFQSSQAAPASLGRFPMYSGYQMSAPTVTFGGAQSATGAAPQAKRREPPPPPREQLVTALVEGRNIPATVLLAEQDIFQVYQNTKALLARAPTIKARYDTRMLRVADREGMTLQAGPIKKFPRAFGKIWFDYGGDHTKIGDVVRSTLVVEDLRELDNMIDAVTSFFPGVVVKRNGWDPAAPVHPSGYRDVFFKGAQIAGFPVELQMNFAQMLDAKGVAHKLYEQAEKLRRAMSSRENPMSPGDLSAAQDKINELEREQFEIYSEAAEEVFDRVNRARQSASDMGTPSDVQVDSPNVRGAVSPVRGLSSQAESPPLGARVTGTPPTSKNVVPAGNEVGIDATLSSPRAIPNESVPQQQVSVQAQRRLPVEPANPLSPTVDAQEAEGRIARRLKRKDGVGSPVNDRVEFGSGNQKLVLGKITAQDWLDRVQLLLSSEELKDSRSWYRQLDEALRPVFGGTTPQYALAWLMSQKRASPTKGMTDVLRAADMAAGKQEVKKAGLNQDALIDILSGRMPEGGIGAKLMDFLDSELGRSTRTIVKDDPRGRQPAAIDVWATRDIGFVDETVFEFLRKRFGDEAVQQLAPDKTTTGESQYEYGIDFYNDVVDFLNSRNFDGGGWTAREVQAVGWVTMQRAMGIRAEFVRDIIGGNTRRVSIGLAPGADSVLAGKLAGKEIPVDVAQREISFLADLAGIRVRQNVSGVGAYLQWIEGAIQIDALASPEAVSDFMDMVGYAFQQTEVISTRPLASGKNMAIDVMSPDLKTVDQATSFFAKFLESAPKDKEGNILAPGFQQIVVDGVPGIRLLNFAGNWRQTQVAEILRAINTTEDSLGVKLTDINTKQVVLESTKNDWKESPNGDVYLNSLRNRGRLQESEQLQRRYAPSRVDVAGDGTVSWQPAAASRVVRLDQPPIRSGTGGGRILGEAQPGASSFVGVHYGNARTETLVGNRYGTGIKGAEARRLDGSGDPRIKRRVYFYIENDMGRMPRAESGLGQYVYSQQFDNILAPGDDMSRLYRASQQDFNAFESSIVDAGYDGYAVPNMGMMVILNHDVPVDYEGTRTEITQRAEKPALTEAGQFSRRDVQLAADGDPRAPRVFGISKTPAVLKAVGSPDQLVVMDPATVMKVVNPGMFGKNTEDAVRRNTVGMVVPVKARIALTVDELRDVPRQIADPVAVFRSEGDRAGRRYGYKVLLDLVKDGNPVVAIVHPDVRYGDDRATQIASVYPMNEDRSLAETNGELTRTGQLLYFHKGKALALASKIGNKLPSLSRTAAVGSKAPGQVPNRQFQPLSNSNFARQVSLQGNRFALGERTMTERVSNMLANEVSRATDVQQQVVAQGGVVTEETNIENSLHRMHGRAGNRIDDFRKNVVRPLIQEAAQQGVDLNDVALYMYANHAAERNAHIASINPQFAGDGSGMSNADAQSVIASLQAKGAQFAKIKSIADRFQAITRLTGQTLLDGGLIDNATLQSWRSGWQYYVPLKGFERIAEGKATGNPRFDPRDPFFRRAMGRGSRAGQIVENILKDYEEAIVAAEKNKLRQAVLKFFLQNPDSALWDVDPMVMQKRWNKTNNIVDYALVKDEGVNTIGVRVNGVPRSIRINDPGLLSDLQMTPLLSGKLAEVYLGVFGSINRTLGKLWTALSPAFVLINAGRDLEYATAKTAVERGGKATIDIWRDFMPVAYSVMRAERNNNWAGNPELRAYYDMYRTDGGKTGFMDLVGLEQRQQRVISDYRNAQASLKEPRTYHRLALRYLQSAEDLIMDVNAGIENAARVAAYKSVIERAGYNHTNAPKAVREEAATVAKNLTVNFNRRGKMTPFLAPLYLFINPAIQGAVSVSKLVMSKKGGALAGSLVGLGYIVATMAAGAAGDDDDPYWDKESNRSAKLKNLMWFGPNGEQYTVPLAYGLGFFVNLGYAMKDLERGRDPWKVAAFMRDSFFTHFSPLGAADNAATFVSPTIVDPFIVLTSEKRENGMPLLPPDYKGGATPDSERYWTNTRDTFLQRFTTWMNEATGGSPGKSGKVDVSPETLSYLLTFTTGGAGTFVKDTITAVDLSLNVGPDAALDKNAYPILKAFYRRDTGRGDQSSFFENSQRVKEAKAELQNAESDNASANARARIRENELFAQLDSSQRFIVKQLSLLRKEEIDIRDNKSLSRREQYDRLQFIDKERRKLESEFNKEFYAIQRQAGEPR